MPRDSAIGRGQAFQRGGQTWVVHYLRDQAVHLNCVQSGARLKLTLDDWRRECLDGSIVAADQADASGGTGQAMSAGAYFCRLGRTWRLLLVKNDVLHFEDVNTHETDRLPMDEFRRGCLDGTIKQIERPGEELDPETAELLKIAFGDLPDAMKASGTHKMRYIEAFNDPLTFYEQHRSDVPVAQRALSGSRSAAKVRPLLRHVAQVIGSTKPPGASTFMSWLAVWRRAEAAGCADVRVLVNKYHKRGPQERFMGARLEEWLNLEIDAVWLDGRKPQKNRVFDALTRRVDRWNNEHPKEPMVMISRRHVDRYIGETVDQYAAMARRSGRKKADEKFRVLQRAPEAEHILQVVEVDHTLSDAQVIDDDTGYVLGRPWVTVALDRFSRMPLACHIHFDGPSLSAVMQALRQTMLPKDFVQEWFPELALGDSFWGVPVCFFFDRGTDFDNDHIRDIGLQLNIRMDLAPIACPYTKGKIERFIKTAHKDVDQPTPGSCPSLLSEGERDEVRGEPAIRFSEFKRRVWLWLYGDYARAWHRGLKDTPMNRWRQSAASYLPRPPRSRDELDVLLTRIEYCAITNYGVRWKHLRWTGEALRMIRTRAEFKGKVKVRIDGQDVSRAWVIDPVTREALPLTPADPEYMAGLSLFEHHLVQCAVDERFDGARDDEVRREARRMLAEEATMLRERAGRTGRAARSLARYDGVGTRASSGGEASNTPPEPIKPDEPIPQQPPVRDTDAQVESPNTQTEPPAPRKWATRAVRTK